MCRNRRDEGNLQILKTQVTTRNHAIIPVNINRKGKISLIKLRQSKGYYRKYLLIFRSRSKILRGPRVIFGNLPVMFGNLRINQSEFSNFALYVISRDVIRFQLVLFALTAGWRSIRQLHIIDNGGQATKRISSLRYAGVTVVGVLMNATAVSWLDNNNRIVFDSSSVSTKIRQKRPYVSRFLPSCEI